MSRWHVTYGWDVEVTDPDPWNGPILAMSRVDLKNPDRVTVDKLGESDAESPAGVRGETGEEQT